MPYFRTFSGALLLSMCLVSPLAIGGDSFEGARGMEAIRAAGIYVPGTAALDISDITIVGSYGYASVDYGLAVFDLSDPANPVVLSGLAVGTPRSLQGGIVFGHLRVRVVGNLAYVPMWNDGVFIIDISDPLNPTQEGHIATHSYAREVMVIGDYAYIAGTKHAGVMVYDVMDPATPVFVFETPLVPLVLDFCHVGNALLAVTLNFVVYDISAPDHPLLDTLIQVPASRCHSVRVRGETAYLTDHDLGYSALGGLGLFDVSDPLAPIFLGKEDSHNYDQGAILVNQVAYVVNPIHGLHAVDVSDKTAPVAVKWYTPIPEGMSVQVHGQFVYLSAGIDGLYLYELSQRGDVNDDGVITSADIIWLVNYIFKGGTPPVVLIQGDADCFNDITMSDVITIVNYVFKSGDPLVCP